MDQRLHDHIISLEERIQTVADRLTRTNLTAQERERYVAELRVAETALAHYRLAFESERELK